MIYIVIPNFNGLDHLEECFNSIRNQSYKYYKVILVDNGSNDDSVDYTTNNYPEIKIISLERNYGFAYATNCGIRYALGKQLCEYVLLLNNDIECDEFFLESLLSGFTNDYIGSTTCKMFNFYKRNRFDTTGDYYDFYSYPFKRGNNEIDDMQYESKGFVFGGCGGATAYKADIFKKIGLLDESFFAYYEDVDFNYRMQLAGYKCLYVPEAKCYHKCGATIKNTPSKKFFLMERNLSSLQIKNHSLKLILKYSLLSVFNRHWNYLRFIKKRKLLFLVYSVIGFWVGFINSFKYLNDRKTIKKITVVSNDYITSIAMDFKRGYKEYQSYLDNFNE